MESKTGDVIEAFKGARGAWDFALAERAAKRLVPQQQLLVIDALRAAEARLKLGRHAVKGSK